MIYIHVPFCKSRCIYCDFYSTTVDRDRNLYVDRLLEEARQRRRFFGDGNHAVKTVYVGGGTPSQIPADQLQRLVDGLSEIFDISNATEFTLEANPEDITEAYASSLPKAINRVSLGVQSFVDDELTMLHRRHNSSKPKEAIDLLRNEAGISNISIDLMYGLPMQTTDSFAYSIDKALSLDTQHISAYCLSVEEGTQMSRLVSQGVLTPADDDLCLSMSDLLRTRLKSAGFIQYEISNFARPGYESQHNSRYWTGDAYLGLGPGAHSYDGKRHRTFNDTDLRSYLNGVRKEDGETLTDIDIYNERVMLGLRTLRGIDYENENRTMQRLIERGLLVRYNDSRVRLTSEGLSLADDVIRQLFI
ncbi:MAG: radical SAM family heme chaperone HemW [Bacteroidales bacterium]|nr:radical SAM family heme chaperone HemW [Candidatus Liminaster caballi]